MSKTTLLFFSLLFLIVSCAANRVELLNDRLEQYNEARQWSVIPQIKGCVDSKKRVDILKDLLPEVESEKVVDYSISDLTFDKKKDKALARIVYTYFKHSDQDVKNRTEQLEWEYSSSQKNWFIVNRSVAR